MQAACPKSLSRTIEFSFNRHNGGSMRVLQVVIALLLTALVTQAQTGWPQYGSDEGGSRYSAAAQINRANVTRLKVAWTYRTGDISDGSDGRSKSKFEATPILFNGSPYLSTPFGRVVALDPAIGKPRWSYDPEIDLKTHYSEGLIPRG